MKAAFASLARHFQNPITRAQRDVVRRSVHHPEHHWTFDAFKPFSGHVEEGFHTFYLGDRASVEVLKWPDVAARDDVAPIPPVDEEYFEWTDILEAALQARGVFTFLELGAGWGRWSARAALAAKQLGKRRRIGLAEADPSHVALIHRHMADNRVDSSEYKVFESAVGGDFGETAFTVSNPNEDPDAWYGQSMVGAVIGDHPHVGEHFGKPKHQLRGGGCEVIKVPKIPLSAVLADYDFIDLIDFDLQMAEREAIAEAIEPLTRKARRLHIGTHSPEVEDALRHTLSGAGWVCLRDYPGNQSNETAFGPCWFVDGVQTWINPRL
jgi:FkbM family methyltransferase